MNTSNKESKYRPVLPASVLLHLYELAEASYRANGDSISFSSLEYLRRYKIKIESGLISEVYSSPAPIGVTELGGIDTKAIWEKYQHHQQNTEGGALAVLSESEIDIALEYAYNKGLLSSSERATYELRLLESMSGTGTNEANNL